MTTCLRRQEALLLLPMLLLHAAFLMKADTQVASKPGNQRIVKTALQLVVGMAGETEPLLVSGSASHSAQVPKSGHPAPSKRLSTRDKFNNDHQSASEAKNDSSTQRGNDRRLSGDKLPIIKTTVLPTLFDDDEFVQEFDVRDIKSKPAASKASRQDLDEPAYPSMQIEEQSVPIAILGTPFGLNETARYQYSLYNLTEIAEFNDIEPQAPLKVSFKDDVSVRSPLLTVGANESAAEDNKSPHSSPMITNNGGQLLSSDSGRWTSDAENESPEAERKWPSQQVATNSAADYRFAAQQVAKRRRRPPIVDGPAANSDNYKQLRNNNDHHLAPIGLLGHEQPLFGKKPGDERYNSTSQRRQSAGQQQPGKQVKLGPPIETLVTQLMPPSERPFVSKQPSVQKKWGTLDGARQRQATTGIRVTIPRDRMGVPLVVNSRGLITAPKHRPAVDQNQRNLQSQLASLQIQEHSLNPIGSANETTDDELDNGLDTGGERPTFLRRPQLQLETKWQRRNSSAYDLSTERKQPIKVRGQPQWVSAQLAGFKPTKKHNSTATVVSETLGDMIDKQTSWQFQSNPPYTKQVQVDATRETNSTIKQQTSRHKAPSTTSVQPKPPPIDLSGMSSSTVSSMEPYKLALNQTISPQLNTLLAANQTQVKPQVFKTKHTLLQQIIRNKLMSSARPISSNSSQPSNSSSPVTPAPLLSSTVASNVANLLASKLSSLVRPALLTSSHSAGALGVGLNSLLGLRVSPGPSGHGQQVTARPSKHRLSPFSNLIRGSNHLNRRTTGVGSLLFQGFFYGLTMLPALMALTGVNPLAGSSDSSQRQSEQNQRPPKQPSYAYLVPLIAAGGGPAALDADEHEEPAAGSDAQQSALRSLYSPPPTVLGSSHDFSGLLPTEHTLEEASHLYGAPSTMSLEHQNHLDSPLVEVEPPRFKPTGNHWPRSANLSNPLLYFVRQPANQPPTHLADDYFPAEFADFQDKMSFASAPKPIFVRDKKPSNRLLDPAPSDPANLIHFSMANSLLVKGAPKPAAVRANILLRSDQAKEFVSLNEPALGNKSPVQQVTNQHLAAERQQNQPIAQYDQLLSLAPLYETNRPANFLIKHPFALDTQPLGAIPAPPNSDGRRKRRTPALVPAYSQFPLVSNLNRPKVLPLLPELGPNDWSPSRRLGAVASGWRAIKEPIDRPSYTTPPTTTSTWRIPAKRSRKQLHKWS